jgi:hypothetical protein|tara:strand:- start:777 stop:1025 length:249 start_codon:yes stop_codon:yes gene_type:complete
MGNAKVDRDKKYMREMWGTDKLTTDYGEIVEKRVLQEIAHDLAPKHDLKSQTELHEKIRNDDDYDDWTYGTEPSYGSSWTGA